MAIRIDEIRDFSGRYEGLSNFAACWVEMDGRWYPTVEHAFQAAKTQVPELKEKIQKARYPGIAKKMGRSLTLRKDWEEVKNQVMLDLLRQKFIQEDYWALLKKTKDKRLVEGNWWHDNYWGVCNCEKCKNKPAKNKLGKLLMQVREEIRYRSHPVKALRRRLEAR